MFSKERMSDEEAKELFEDVLALKRHLARIYKKVAYLKPPKPKSINECTFGEMYHFTKDATVPCSEFSVRLYAALQKLGLIESSDLLPSICDHEFHFIKLKDITRSDIVRQKNIGDTTIKELHDIIREAGIVRKNENI